MIPLDSKASFCALFVVSLLACGTDPTQNGNARKTSGDGIRPNILLIVVDDMGFGDLGSFGSEIETPNLDRLAYRGIRLTNFHAAPTCSPSRAMLLTGVDSHKAGLGNMREEMAPNQSGQPGYEGHLNERVVTVASLLKDAGYRTYMTGKWHLGATKETGPACRGFERSFSSITSGSHFSDMRPAYAPTPETKAGYREDHELLEKLPDDFNYSTEFFADRMIRYLEEERGTDRPFFAYLAFTAPHWPLQASDEAIARQEGRYDDGYDVVLAERFRNLKAMGLIPESATVNSRPPKGRPWSSLSADERKTESRAMEIYAAMIEQIDRHTGRLLDYLETSGQLDDTAIIFMSDNGAEGHDLDETWPREHFPEIRKTVDESHDFSYENMGRPGSYTLYGRNWARASSPAFKYHKAFVSEGGTRTAAFVHYPGRFAADTLSDAFISIKDITPTLLDLARVEHPGDSYMGRPIEPMTGRSVLPLLEGAVDVLPDRPFVMELMGKRVVRSGPWKLVHEPAPFGVDAWQLFDLGEDLAEQRDVATEHPEIVEELAAIWQRYYEDNNVILPDSVSGY